MSAHPVDWKRDHELRTFQQFCDAAGKNVIAGSIQQSDPPAPDVIADFLDRGRCAFELVRLNDPDQLTRMSLMNQTPQFLQTAFAALPVDRHADLNAKYADGIITIQFRGAVNFARRREALPFIWDTLASQSLGFSGKVDLWGLEAPDAVELIWVSRGRTVGGVPNFKTQTTGYVLPRASDRIRAKLVKRYQCTEPLDLLAYVHWGELAHMNAEDEIAAIVSRHLPGSQFRQVWVYEGLLRRVALRLSNAA